MLPGMPGSPPPKVPPLSSLLSLTGQHEREAFHRIELFSPFLPQMSSLGKRAKEGHKEVQGSVPCFRKKVQEGRHVNVSRGMSGF